MYIPKYKLSYDKGKLHELSKILNKRLQNCDLCPHKCYVNRHNGEFGICNTGKYARVASYGPHFGEEKPLVGEKGSGTIFFSGCNLNCIFCQNYDISHDNYGYLYDSEQLSDIMMYLQNLGCHNINFVTPTHVVPQIIDSLIYSAEKGLHIPLVYNSSAYDNLEIVQLLRHAFDIYMPDFKFFNNEKAMRVCNADDYVDISKRVLKEMHDQVGILSINNKNTAESGLLIRHLVMPGNFADSKEILKFIADEISVESYINIMSQYRPLGMAYKVKEISSTLNYSDYQRVLEYAKKLGFMNFI